MRSSPSKRDVLIGLGLVAVAAAVAIPVALTEGGNDGGGAARSVKAGDRSIAQPGRASGGRSGRGKPAPDFSLETLDGSKLTLDGQRGRTTVLFFMAYWCGTCIPEAKALADIHEQYHPRGVDVVAVDVDPTSSPNLLRQFSEEVGSPGYGWAIDSDVARDFRVRSFDTTQIIDRTGRIAYKDEQVTDFDIYSAALEPLL